MRLSAETQTKLAQAIREAAPASRSIRLFGSRLNDEAKGGDIDLMVEFDQPVDHPALLAAALSVQASRVANGRQVDIVLKAPNLKELSIHRIAIATGVEI